MTRKETTTGDPNIREVQTYLNAIYGHRSDWTELEINGYTGTITIEAIIKAFQIENGIEAVGEVGLATLAKIKSMAPITQMDPNSESSPIVCLLQCALFCKGYAAGGITGIYYTSGVAAVKNLQEDANIGVTGVVDWKVWSALLSFNWFTKPADPFTEWDPNIRTIQRQLNKEYSDYINVRACDGIMSRETALSVLGALQAAEGILSPNETLTNLNELNFGERTQKLFPGPIEMGSTKTKYVKLIQYGLYFNGYDPGNFNGVFDSEMFYAVSNFQKFYALEDIILDSTGSVGTSTMMSLLTSRGDTSRPALACDCSVILNSQQVADLYEAEYRHIGRYLTGTVGNDFRPKALTSSEIQRITSSGIRIFPIYQDGGYYLDYFKNGKRGSSDATIAIDAALQLGFPYGTIIYFAVDFDCLPHETENYIVDYFSEINGVFSTTVNTKQYKVGVYGPRQVCSELCNRLLAVSSFVSDMSSGFTGNCGYPLPLNWAFDQFWETTFTSSPSFDLDKVAVSIDGNKDKGCLIFDEAQNVTDHEREERIYRKYFNKFLLATATPANAFSYDIKFSNAKILVGSYNSLTWGINVYIESKTSLSGHTNSSLIDINIVDGKVTADFIDTLKNILSVFNWDALGDAAQDSYNMVIKHCVSIAEEMQVGNSSVPLC